MNSAGCSWLAESWQFDGIALDSTTGCIYGTPSAVRSATVRFDATDSKGHTYIGRFTIQVKSVPPTVVVDTTTLPAQAANQPYSEHLHAFGGQEPYIWKLAAGSSLPTGLSWDASGRIYGTPTAAGATTFQVSATDASSPPKSSQQATIAISLNASPDCNNSKYGEGKYFNGWIPLSVRKERNPNGDSSIGFLTNNDVVCFWGASGQIAPLTQVQYLYGFGQGTNTISADMISIQFPSPIGAQVSLGTSVTGGGSTNSTPGQTSATAAIASLEAGGNFYLHFLYPIFVYNSNSITFLAAINARAGFSVNGFAGQSTLSQGTEQYVSAPAEVYFAYNAIGSAGGVYGDYRGGLQSVPGGFKVAAGLPSNVFGLQQASFGFNFAGLMRIGAQRYFGPAAGFNAPTGANFGKWHLVIQLSPGTVKGS
jgi:hypothetical protein